jgi:hypothetical protein
MSERKPYEERPSSICGVSVELHDRGPQDARPAVCFQRRYREWHRSGRCVFCGWRDALPLGLSSYTLVVPKRGQGSRCPECGFAYE